MSPRSSAAAVSLRILSDPAYLCVVRSAAERFCRVIGFDDASAQAIGLALDEALANVIRHGYRNEKTHPIHVEFHLQPASSPTGTDSSDSPAVELCICVRDFAQQVDASQIVPRSLDDIRPGGLGVHIMRSVMDRVEFRRRGLAGMELHMTKKHSAAAGEPGAKP